MALTALKIAVFAPIHIPSVSTTTSANPGDRDKTRKQYRRSATKLAMRTIIEGNLHARHIAWAHPTASASMVSKWERVVPSWDVPYRYGWPLTQARKDLKSADYSDYADFPDELQASTKVFFSLSPQWSVSQ